MALSLSADEEDYESESEQVRQQNIDTEHIGFIIGMLLFFFKRGFALEL